MEQPWLAGEALLETSESLLLGSSGHERLIRIAA
jgi:hypothetical protein